MNIETVEELCEYLADKAGIYSQERIEFVREVEERIRKAISNENTLSKLHQPTVISAVCDNPHCKDGIVIEMYGETYRCSLCEEKQTDRKSI